MQGCVISRASETAVLTLIYWFSFMPPSQSTETGPKVMNAAQILFVTAVVVIVSLRCTPVLHACVLRLSTSGCVRYMFFFHRILFFGSIEIGRLIRRPSYWHVCIRASMTYDTSVLVVLFLLFGFTRRNYYYHLLHVMNLPLHRPLK